MSIHQQCYHAVQEESSFGCHYCAKEWLCVCTGFWGRDPDPGPGFRGRGAWGQRWPLWYWGTSCTFHYLLQILLRVEAFVMCSGGGIIQMDKLKYQYVEVLHQKYNIYVIVLIPQKKIFYYNIKVAILWRKVSFYSCRYIVKKCVTCI